MIVDTGFGGFLSSPYEVIDRLRFPWKTANIATLGDRTISGDGNALWLSIAGRCY
jgi:predicted aspartyl protease